MISQVDPLVRLELLREYMIYWINRYPVKTKKFYEYLHDEYSHLIPGTVENAKSIATHCFYCNRKFQDEIRIYKRSIDHFIPKAIGPTSKFVICCADCNNRKGSDPPDVILSILIKANLRGAQYWGYQGKKLKFIMNQFQTISNDILYNTGPRIYYFKR